MSLFTDQQIKELQEAFKELAHQAGKEYMEHFQASFDNEGFTDDKLVKWAKRKKKDKNKKKRNLLVGKGSGRLRRSFRKKVRGTKVLIYTATPYAEIHNEGGIVKATVKVRAHTRKSKRGRKKTVTKVKGHTRNMNTKIPKRQFMGESRKVTKGLERQMEKEFKRIFKLK